MMLTAIVEAVVTLLNSSPGKWGGTGTTVIATLDYVTALNKTDLQILIVPDVIQYNLDTEQSQRRKAVITTNTTKVISIMIGKGFTQLALTDDVAPWAESKELIDLRERINQYLIANPLPGIALLAMEEIPIDELELDHRNFIAVTQVGFEVLQCGSGPGLLSS